MPRVEGVLVPRRSFVAYLDGRLVRFRKGRTTVRRGHPILRGREADFRPLEVDFDIERPTPVAATRRPPRPAGSSTR